MVPYVRYGMDPQSLVAQSQGKAFRHENLTWQTKLPWDMVVALKQAVSWGRMNIDSVR